MAIFIFFQHPIQNATVRAKQTFIATSPTTLVTQSVNSFLIPFGCFNSESFEVSYYSSYL